MPGKKNNFVRCWFGKPVVVVAGFVLVFVAMQGNKIIVVVVGKTSLQG
jgi:hypothetical protein